jgi:chemotaxis response regulator CheB
VNGHASGSKVNLDRLISTSELSLLRLTMLARQTQYDFGCSAIWAEHARRYPAQRLTTSLVAIAWSRGSLEALTTILRRLTMTFPTAIVIAHRLEPARRTYMAELLTRITPLKVKLTESGDTLTEGSVFIASGSPPCH